MSEPPRVAFKFGGFKKPVLSNVSTTPSAFETSTTSGTDRPELVTGFDNGEIRSNAPAVVKKEFVIPSQPNAHQFFKSKPAAPKKTTTVATPAIDQLEDEAKRALILDAQQANEAWNDRDQNGAVRVHTIEQDATNTFMAGGSTADADGAPAEEEPEVDNADYEQVPIEEFGMAVLRGMGYKDDSGLGITNKQQVNVFVPESRPRGLGLGADRKVLEKINQLKRNLKKAGIDEKDDLCLEKGAFVLVEKGPHADLYGTIESIEEDVARLTVSLAIGGTNKKKEVISISQYSVKLVTEKEFLKYSKYVNKSKADRVEKETSDRLMKDYRDRDDKRPRSSRDNDDADYERRHHRSSNSDRHDRKQHRDRHDDSSRSRRH